MVEYASITAALAILTASLAGALSSGVPLPTNDVRGTALVVKAARSERADVSEARAAYAKAPFRKPALRYLYAVGWITASSDPAACHTGLLLGPKPKIQAAQAIQRSPKLLARIRAARLTVSQAATALGRGTTDGCT